MSQFLFIFTLSLSLTACVLTVPQPPACVDDGRGMIPLNPDKFSESDIKASRKVFSRAHTSNINQPRG